MYSQPSKCSASGSRRRLPASQRRPAQQVPAKSQTRRRRRERAAVSCQSLRRDILMFDPAILHGEDQVGGPIELPVTEPGWRETRLIGLRLNGLQTLQVFGLAHAG